MAKKLEWTTEKRRVNDLVELEFNPRKITEEKRQKLIESLEKFNLAEIPAINTDNKVVAGNQRLKALQIAGRGEEMIDVRVPNRKLTDKELKEYALISNTHAGEWDFDILGVEFADVDLGFAGLDMKQIEFEQSPGFEKQMDTFFARKEAKQLQAEEDDFEVPEGGSTTDIVLGDLFEIGEHRLLCGDSTDSDAVAKLMNGEKADLYLSDPPYGVSYSEKNKFLNTISRGNSIQIPIENDSKTPEEMYAFWLLCFSNICNILKEKSSYYIFSPQGGDLLLLLLQAVRDSGFQLKHVLVWVKNNHVLGRADYNYKHEPIVFGWKQNGTHIFYGEGSRLTSVWDFPKPLKNDLHPTMKPIAVIENALLNSTIINDLIVDNFLGSGSTMVASHQLQRKCYGMEIDPKYCQVIVDRMLKLDPALVIKRNGEVWERSKQLAVAVSSEEVERSNMATKATL